MAGIDQIAAHLDRAWDLLDRLDYDAAVRSARQAADLQPENPEAHYLLGAIEGRAARFDEALRHYKDAIEADDGYVDAFLAAAEIHLAQFGRWEQCVELCDEVLSFVEDPRDVADATLLKFEAYRQAGDQERAVDVLDEIEHLDHEDAALHQRTGIALYEVERIDAARVRFERAVELDPDLADAHYYLGLCHLEDEDHVQQIAAWLRTRELDVRQAHGRAAPDADDFAVLARRVVEGMPRGMRTKLKGASVFVELHPGVEVVAEGVDPRMLVWIVALPPLEGEGDGDGRGVGPGQQTGMGPVPSAIVVYLHNFLRVLPPDADVEAELRAAVAHEASHFFGIDEDRMRRMGLGGLHRGH